VRVTYSDASTASCSFARWQAARLDSSRSGGGAGRFFLHSGTTQGARSARARTAAGEAAVSARSHRTILVAALALASALFAPGSGPRAGGAIGYAGARGCARIRGGEGRLTGSVGERRASEYIVSQLKRIGALPLPEQTTIVAVPVHRRRARRRLVDRGVLGRRRNANFSARADVQALSLSDEGMVSGPVVFAATASSCREPGLRI